LRKDYALLKTCSDGPRVTISENELLKQLREAANQGRGREPGDRFFGQFGDLHPLRPGAGPDKALAFGLRLLDTCARLAPEAYAGIHKGTPFYFLGMAAFLVHDYETAVFFFDAGVSEDLDRGADPIHHSTPGLQFIQIEGEPAGPRVNSCSSRSSERNGQSLITTDAQDDPPMFQTLTWLGFELAF